MSLSEFEIIEHYFANRKHKRSDVVLGVGDDCAILKAPPGFELVSTIDAIVEGVHFPADSPAYDIGHKAMAVSLSDIAAMGADPAWVLLALNLPESSAEWLEQFCAGYFTLLDQFSVDLVGGNITRGSLSVTSHVHGLVPSGAALRRDGAQPGDLIYVTGTLGDAGLGLRALLKQIELSQDGHDYVVKRFYRPEPRIREGQALRGLASAAIDISDGLVADMNHILERSQAGARLDVERLPLSSALTDSVDREEANHLALTAGEDYELCFTVPPDKKPELETFNEQFTCGFTEIGVIEQAPGLRVFENNRPYRLDKKGWEHCWK